MGGQMMSSTKRGKSWAKRIEDWFNIEVKRRAKAKICKAVQLE
jgi:hypothetical protein